MTKLRVGQRVRIGSGLHADTPGTIEVITAGRVWVSHVSPYFLPDGPEGTVLLPYGEEELEPLLHVV